jgi:hypothetical protein
MVMPQRNAGLKDQFAAPGAGEARKIVSNWFDLVWGLADELGGVMRT